MCIILKIYFLEGKTRNFVFLWWYYSFFTKWLVGCKRSRIIIVNLNNIYYLVGSHLDFILSFILVNLFITGYCFVVGYWFVD
jgi:hypothetical protein